MSTEAAKLFWVSDFIIGKHVDSGLPINLFDHLATLPITSLRRDVTTCWDGTLRSFELIHASLALKVSMDQCNLLQGRSSFVELLVEEELIGR